MRDKPSLAALIAQQVAGAPKSRRRAAKQKPAPPAEAGKQVAPFADERPAELARELLVRRFVTAYLREHMSASAALRAVRPEVSKKSSRELAHRLLECDDVRTELVRQLKGIHTHADLDEAWVYAQLRAMAHSNIFDFITIDERGVLSAVNLDPDKLTPEQQLSVRRLKFDKQTGRVVDIELIDRKSAVDSIARARQMFRELDDRSMDGLAQEITERMQLASKKVRVFDHATGEEIDESS